MAKNGALLFDQLGLPIASVVEREFFGIQESPE